MQLLSLFIHMARLVYTSYENMSSPEILPHDHNTELIVLPSGFVSCVCTLHPRLYTSTSSCLKYKRFGAQ